jgi:hypothetical protein
MRRAGENDRTVIKYFLMLRRDGRQERRKRNMRVKRKAGTLAAALAVLAGISVAILGCAAGGANCMTNCKEGPREYQTNFRWVCLYDEVGSAANFATHKKTENISYSCALKIAGRLKSVDSVSGDRFTNERDCFEQFCIPKLVEICGMEDRCAEPKNWLDRPSLRRKFGN